MKQLFYLFSFIVIASCFNSCSNDDEKDWMYGNEQVLANTEWLYTIEMDGAVPNIPFPTEVLRFNAQELTMIFTSWKYDENIQEVQEVTSVKRGNYEYKHPKLKLFFEDGEEIEAWISPTNEICYYGENGEFREFSRQ